MTHDINSDADAFVSCRKYKKRTNKFQVKKQEMLQMRHFSVNKGLQNL